MIINQCNNDNLNKNIRINGWIERIRKLGKIIFLNIYDKSGIIQVVCDDNNSYYDEILKLPKQSCVCVSGKLKVRKEINEKIELGSYEIILESITIYSFSKTPPLLIQDDTDALEETRLKYRFLDLRRPVMQRNISFRSKFTQEVRSYLHSIDFTEISTPILSKQTPEGSKDFIVSSKHKSLFFALPQSPQIYKQLLMVSGFNKYFQIAKCFRCEDLRVDRQLEFEQIDLELSFTNEEEIFSIIENLMVHIFKKLLNIELKLPFSRIKYDDAINYYGSDKPDLRYEYKIKCFKSNFLKSKINLFSNLSSNFLKGIILNDYIIDAKAIKHLEKFAKDNGAKSIITVTFENNKIISGSIAKNIEYEIIKEIFSDQKVNKGSLLMVMDSDEKIVLKALGSVRSEAIKFFKIEPKEEYNFSWVVDWPLFEYSNEEKRYVASHHPFTSPSSDYINTFDVDLKNARARSYDLVLNGYELGSGSIRISDRKIQQRMFEVIGLTNEQVQERFGFLLSAFDYGVCPHGGIALGIERLLMIMLHTDSIRDVVAFPVNSSGFDLMLNCPSRIDENLLNEAGIWTKK